MRNTINMNLLRVMMAAIISISSFVHASGQEGLPMLQAEPQGGRGLVESEETIATPELQEDQGLSRDRRPGPLGKTPFTFPDYKEFTTDEGLHVFLVENHAVPTVTFSIAIRGGDAFDPEGKEGTAEIMGDMLSKGTKNQTAKQQAIALDGVGASIGVRVSGESMSVSGSSLKKHSTLLFKTLGDMLTTPTFDEDELEKLRKQYLASVASEKGDAMGTTQALSRKIIYGWDNPLSRRMSEESVNAVTQEDLQNFFKKHVLPNNASIAFVGDVTEEEVREFLKKHLGNWKKGDTPELKLPYMNTAQAGVYFIPRPGSVQSSIIVCAAAPAVSNEIWLPLNVATSYFGSSFGSILFETLRETHSYTYSPFGFSTRGGKYNRVAVGAEVRTSVTDSALNVILRELNRLNSEGPDERKLDNRIAQLAGQYRLQFERPSTVAAILQNGWITNQPKELVTTYTERLEKLSWGEVKRAVNMYLDQFKLRIAVVGDPKAFDMLKQFGAVYEYDMDLKPLAITEYEDADLDIEDLLKEHTKALGGSKKVRSIKSVKMEGRVSMIMQGREMEGNAKRILMVPNKEFTSLQLQGMAQAQWLDGKRGWVSLNDGPSSEMPANESDALIEHSRIFPGLVLGESGWETEIRGKFREEIYVDAKSPSGAEALYVFNANNLLLDRIEKVETTGKGPITNIESFDNFVDVSGVKMPSKVVTNNSIFSVTYMWKYVANKDVKDSDFTPKDAK